MKLLKSTMNVPDSTVILSVTDQFSATHDSSAMTLEDVDKLIVDLHKVRIGLAIASKSDIGMEMATKKMLQVEEEKIRSILLPDQEPIPA
jgi:hypothetical protein